MDVSKQSSQRCTHAETCAGGSGFHQACDPACGCSQRAFDFPRAKDPRQYVYNEETSFSQQMNDHESKSWTARFMTLLWLLALLVLSACSGGSGGTGGEVGASAVPPPVETTADPADAGIEPAPSPTLEDTAADGGSFSNPVLDRDFPDPDLVRVGEYWYAYATNSSGANIQAARSKDLVEWELLGDALPSLPLWAVPNFGWAWAPEVSPAAGGEGYQMYFTARFKIGQGGTQCIGLAESPAPEGPFMPVGDEPFVCQTGEGGSIDASVFQDDDGQRYLLWKNDGNSGGGQSWLYIQPLSGDGRSLEGEPARLLTANLPWEGILVEAPTLWKFEGRYYLFYSANAFNEPRYATGYAVSDELLGPYTKARDPLLKTNLAAGVVGPGGQDLVVEPDGDTWILFHGWTPGSYRALYLAPLEWQDGEPVVDLQAGAPVPAP